MGYCTGTRNKSNTQFIDSALTTGKYINKNNQRAGPPLPILAVWIISIQFNCSAPPTKSTAATFKVLSDFLFWTNNPENRFPFQTSKLSVIDS